MIPPGGAAGGASCCLITRRGIPIGGAAGVPGTTTTCNSQFSPIENGCDADATPGMMEYRPSSFDLTAMPTCPDVS